MKFTKNRVFTSFVLILLLFNACNNSKDTRVLGSIGNKEYTVDSLISLILAPDEIEKTKKDLSDVVIAEAFKKYAMTTVFAKEADKTGFFKNQPEMQKILDAQMEKSQKAIYQRYIGQNIIKPMMDKITVSDSDLEPYKKRAQVRHILLANDGSMKDPVKGKNLEAQILKELNGGANFADLAKKYSEDKGSKESGGLIPQWIYDDGSFVPEFTKAALGAKKNHEIIPDVVSQFGLHIIYIENIQDRSVSDIKDNDPQIYNRVLQTKKNEVSQQFEKKLMEDFSVEKNPSLDFKTYFQNYSSKTEGETLYTINKTISYTGKDFFEKVLQGDKKQIQLLLKNTSPEEIEETVKNYGVLSYIMDLYVQQQGADKDPYVQDTIQLQELATKAGLYIQDLIKAKGPKPVKMPKYSATPKEIQTYYDTNKSMFTQTTDDGKKTTVTPLTKDLKNQIKNMIIYDKTQEFQQKESAKMLEFVEQQATLLFPQYKVVFNPDFIKPEKNNTDTKEK